MPTPKIENGSPCWIDLMTANPEQSKDFYQQLMGWTYETGDEEKYGGYIMAFKDGRPVAGLMKNDGQSGYPDVWSTYLRVEDINAAAEAAAASGGQVYMPPMEVPEQGHMALFGDAGGAAIGAWQFGDMTGFEAHDESGAPVWHELQTRDYAAAVKFYQDVFGWQTGQTMDMGPMGTYQIFNRHDRQLGGMMNKPKEMANVPPNWQIYFRVPNVDAAAERVKAAGGQVINGPMDVPDGDRVLNALDPQGAAFGLHSKKAS
jgi:uncharacterized protein